jgi:hypothetical protein
MSAFRSLVRIILEWRHLAFVGPQYETEFMLHFWRLEFLAGF